MAKTKPKGAGRVTRLIVLRGNSGSGKTATARELQRVLGSTALLISQDVVRRKILHAPDTAGTPAIAVIAELIAWGRAQGFAVIILEGILKRSVYGEFLRDLKQAWGSAMVIGYFDVTFATTVKRNQTKAQSFSRAQLTRWWLGRDLLGSEAVCFDESSTVAEQCQRLLQEVAGTES